MTTGFHARNAISNNITGFMVHGVDWFKIPETLDANAAAIYAMKKGDVSKALKEVNMTPGMYKRLLNKRYGDYSLKELADFQLKSGLLSEAQMGLDAKNAFQKVMTKGSKNPLSNDFIPREWSQKLGGWIENSAKFKSFLIDYKDIMNQTKGMAADVASSTSDDALKYAERKAKKWWLDYSDLTEFEQKTMKNIIPFYSWMRKNIGNQLEGILVYPQTFSIFPKAMEAMEYDDPDFNPEDIPEWMRDLGAFPVSLPGMEKGTSIFRPDMPFADLNKIPMMFEEGSILPKIDPSELKDDIVNSLHPGIKTIMSLATNKGYDFFRKQDLKPDAEAPEFMQWLVKKPEALGIIDGMFNLVGMEGFKPTVDNDGKLRVNSKWLQFFENNMPIIRNMDLIIETGTSATQIEEALQEAADYEEDDDKADLLFKVLGSLTGIKFYAMDSDSMTQASKNRRYSEADKRRLDARFYDDDRVQSRATSREKKEGIVNRVIN